MKYIIILLLICNIGLTVHAQQCDKINGIWLNKGGEGKVQIYAKSGKYFGKLIWMKIADKQGKLITDARNINPSLRKRPLLGLELLKNFSCHGKIYEDGTIYDPRHGKTGTGKLTLMGDKLHVEGYMGMFLVGDETWTRVK